MNNINDSSSDEEDFYSSLSKNMKRKATDPDGVQSVVFTNIGVLCGDSPMVKNKRNKIQEIIIGDSDSEGETEDFSLDFNTMLRKQAEQAKLQEHKDLEKNLADIQNSIEVPNTYAEKVNVFSDLDPSLTVAEINMAEIAQSVKGTLNASQSSLSESLRNSSVTEDSENSDDISLFVNEADSDKSECNSWPITKCFKDLRNSYATKYDCVNNDIIITYNDKPISDSDTPGTLGMERGQLYFFNVVRVVSLERPKDPNLFKVKCLQADKRPVFVEVSKISTFEEIKKIIAKALKLEKVNKICFDSEHVEDTQTPEDLDMEEEDCIEIYA